MNIINGIQERLDEIKRKQERLEEMSEIWENSDNECARARACSDPSDQFCLSEEIENDLLELKKFINENID